MAQTPGITIIRVIPNGAKAMDCGGGWDISSPMTADQPCDLQYALTRRSAIVNPVLGLMNEIWVKAGTYYPDPPSISPFRYASFIIKRGITLYGGFKGDETTRDGRNWKDNITILSGDIDSPTTTPPAHSIHVVTIELPDSTVVLDGFTITGGQADSQDTSCYGMGGCGGGIYIARGIQIYSGNPLPLLANLTVTGNTATVGGGIGNQASNIKITNSEIINNTATNGGGLYNNGDMQQDHVRYSGNSAAFGGAIYNYYGSLSMSDCVIDGNSALVGDGGGIYGNLIMRNCTVSNNSSTRQGGGLYLINNPQIENSTINGNSANFGGGVFIYNGGGRFINSTISENTASRGGGVFNYISAPEFKYVTLANNTAMYGGGIFNSTNSQPKVNASIMWNNHHPDNSPNQIFNYDTTGMTIVDYSDIQDGCSGSGFSCTNSIDADPMLGTLGDYGGDTQTMPLGPGSAAVDRIPSYPNMGCSYYNTSTDQRGVKRPLVAGCDMGAYEAGSSFYLPVIMSYRGRPAPSGLYR